MKNTRFGTRDSQSALLAAYVHAQDGCYKAGKGLVDLARKHPHLATGEVSRDLGRIVRELEDKLLVSQAASYSALRAAGVDISVFNTSHLPMDDWHLSGEERSINRVIREAGGSPPKSDEDNDGA